MKSITQNSHSYQDQLETLHKLISRLVNKDYNFEIASETLQHPCFLALQSLRNQLFKQKQEEIRKNWIIRQLQFYQKELSQLTSSSNLTINNFAQRVLGLICSSLYIEQALFYALPHLNTNQIEIIGHYANNNSTSQQLDNSKPLPELIQKVIEEKKIILLPELPPGYLKIYSGLGQAVPTQLLLLPILLEEQVLGVLELASFTEFDSTKVELLQKLCEILSIKLFRIQYLQNSFPSAPTTND
ncbi:MAG: hypothetical protein RML72_09780 [Bacteroidia bacterium]|nr:hypothetical protein [Bacteroidia bacterium]MDW8159145.1 hypothetical protein [Bacteroidia bacterium]